MKWTLAILAASGRVAPGCWWWTMIRVRWALVCRQSRLSTRKPQDQKRLGMNGHSALDARAWQAPRLRRVRIRRHVVALTVRTRPGQTVIELEDAAERLAATFDAHAFRTHPHPRHPSSTLIIDMVMRDALTKVRTATEPEPSVACDVVRLGRTQRGGDWRLPIRGRHTLCVGASGAGKGSVLWGIACGLAPAAHADVVRLWGVDLKRGIELAMGERLFRTLAYTPEAALQVLKDLVDVIDERGALMVGKTRLHAPTVGDPLHVLVIDELAALTAYAPLDVRREADKLLGTILTQGRALGVVVVAFVQDPRKEVVGMRNLFTQTIGLRLRSGDETAMVLGDGMHRLAPAHRIHPGRPGTGWVVEDTGAVDRVRADYWTDELIREVASRYPALPEVNLDDLEQMEAAR